MTNSRQVQSKLNIENWDGIDWKQAEKSVFRLQKRIYRASEKGNEKVVRKLQKLLQRSTSAKLLAVRRVTQENQGKKTAGVDGVKSLAPRKRLKLVKELKINKVKSKPTRRVLITKANGKTRPLGIPTMYDRALQALVKLALEPEWEARFEPNSFGFRSSRGCHDAIEGIFDKIYMKNRYVLDADITGCFDNINHTALLDKINTYPTLRRQLKSWLKAGCITNGVFEPTKRGTPQGGIISPLLANIALHGLEERLNEYAASWKGQKAKNISSLGFVRYADDFVITHHDLNVIKECESIVSEWLSDIGLQLNAEKTRIVHTLAGFDFLGFNVRQHEVGKRKSGKDCKKRPLGFKTIIKPSKDSVKKHYDQIADKCNKLQAAPQGKLINALNPTILGWSNYFSSAVSAETFKKLDFLVWRRIWRWCKRRHPKKSSKWVMEKYFRKIGNRNWVFSDGESTLRLHADTKIIRHIKVKGNKSPFDGDFPYWARRMRNHPQASMRVSKLLKRQKGICNHCGLYFRAGQVAEVDHIIPRNTGGKDIYTNLQLLHKHCHDSKSKTDGSFSRSKRIKLLASSSENY